MAPGWLGAVVQGFSLGCLHPTLERLPCVPATLLLTQLPANAPREAADGGCTHVGNQHGVLGS